MLTSEYFERVRDEERAEQLTRIRENVALMVVLLLFILGAILAG